MGGKKRRQYKKIVDNDISSDDLAIIGAGFTVLGDLFDLLSLLKLKEELTDTGTSGESAPIGETPTLLDDYIVVTRSKK